MLKKSSAVKIKGAKLLGKFTEAAYDSVIDPKEVFAKAALLNFYTKLTDLKEPTDGSEPWFSFVREIVEIGRERLASVRGEIMDGGAPRRGHRPFVRG